MHDRAALAAMLGGHALDCLARADERRGDVEGPQFLQRAPVVELVHPCIRADDAGAVDEMRDRAELLVHRLEHADDVGLLGHVRLDRDGLGTRLLAGRDYLVRTCLVAYIVDADRLVTRLGRADTGGGAQAPAAAGHNQHSRHGLSPEMIVLGVAPCITNRTARFNRALCAAGSRAAHSGHQSTRPPGRVRWRKTM